MFTSAKIRNGSTYLANHLSANDYYAKGERVTGEWVGEGAGSLGLSGEVRPEDFEALRVNLRPGTGERLTPRDQGYASTHACRGSPGIPGKGRPVRHRSGGRQFSPHYEASFKPGSIL